MRSISCFAAVAFLLIASDALVSQTGYAAKAPKPETPTANVPADFWVGLDRHEIQLKQKLLVVKGSKGIVACPYVDVGIFTRTKEACAIVPAADIDGMLRSKVKAVSPAARELGIEVGMSGREALERIR